MDSAAQMILFGLYLTLSPALRPFVGFNPMQALPCGGQGGLQVHGPLPIPPTWGRHPCLSSESPKTDSHWPSLGYRVSPGTSHSLGGSDLRHPHPPPLPHPQGPHLSHRGWEGRRGPAQAQVILQEDQEVDPRRQCRLDGPHTHSPSAASVPWRPHLESPGSSGVAPAWLTSGSVLQPAMSHSPHFPTRSKMLAGVRSRAARRLLG